MFEVHKKTITWAGKKLTLETGKVARQADGAVLATYGDTVVLCTVVGSKAPRPDIDFFPLTVHYQEKFYATGRIPGGFFKREGRPSEKETLTSRLIDRPIRPLFHPNYKNDTQVICTTLSHDLENNPDIVAMIGASAALTISGIPFMGPIGAARVGYINGQMVLNPTTTELKDSELDLTVAGTVDSLLMVESEAKELPEDVMMQALMFGLEGMKPVIDAIISLAESCAKEPWVVPEKAYGESLINEVAAFSAKDIAAAFKIQGKQDRTNRLNEIKAAILEKFTSETVDAKSLGSIFKELESRVVRDTILDTGERIDGRKVHNIRPINVQVGILPRTHGSALFTRGETQSIVVATLGTGDDEQMIDSIEGIYKENFMLHYNFPPYSVGEASPMRAPGRREIGHGKLAWRALRAIIPTKEEFPYVLRLVSEITESNGSSSMATVCGSSLALMDAGVPIKRPVAGIAMGLIKEGDKFAVLSDILGDEDHLGDMDFKVAGTEKGITSLQMDMKIAGITEEIMRVAVKQAGEGRAHILGEMNKIINTSREEISENAPRITTIRIPKDKIREVIGSGGSVIRDIVEKSGAKIDIQDDGTVSVASVGKEASDIALKMIEDIVAEAEVGAIYTGKVVRLMDFGAFVNFLGSRDGLVHISELGEERVGKVTDVVNEGDIVKVKCLEVDSKGKVRLSLRLVNQETGEDLEGREGIRPVQKVEPRERDSGRERFKRRG